MSLISVILPTHLIRRSCAYHLGLLSTTCHIFIGVSRNRTANSDIMLFIQRHTAKCLCVHCGRCSDTLAQDKVIEGGYAVNCRSEWWMAFGVVDSVRYSVTVRYLFSCFVLASVFTQLWLGRKARNDFVVGQVCLKLSEFASFMSYIPPSDGTSFLSPSLPFLLVNQNPPLRDYPHPLALCPLSPPVSNLTSIRTTGSTVGEFDSIPKYSLLLYDAPSAHVLIQNVSLSFLIS
jgi:hypothetical protein